MPDTIRGPLLIKQMKERATVGQYAPNLPGYTRTTMVRTEGPDFERRRKSLNLALVQIVG